jgi:hypothetical protein
MKALIALLAAVSTMAFAKTVILYDDGSQYTVEDSEHVYVSNYSRLYQMKQYSKGDIQLRKVSPWTGRDRVYIENPNPIGTRQWCEAHDLHANGYTFDDQYWLRACDVNGDRVYDMCDWYQPTGIPTFDELTWRDKCNNGEPWGGE